MDLTIRMRPDHRTFKISLGNYVVQPSLRTTSRNQVLKVRPPTSSINSKWVRRKARSQGPAQMTASETPSLGFSRCLWFWLKFDTTALTDLKGPGICRVSHSYKYSFTVQICIENFLCARACPGRWRLDGRLKPGPFPVDTHTLVLKTLTTN